jgi:hypothetical protein
VAAAGVVAAVEVVEAVEVVVGGRKMRTTNFCKSNKKYLKFPK